MFSPIWGKGNGRGISGFAVNWGAVNRGFTVVPKTLKLFATLPINLEIQNTYSIKLLTSLSNGRTSYAQLG